MTVGSEREGGKGVTEGRRKTERKEREEETGKERQANFYQKREMTTEIISSNSYC